MQKLVFSRRGSFCFNVAAHCSVLFLLISDDTGEELERQGMGATEEEKMQGAIDLLVNQEQLWREMFFR